MGKGGDEGVVGCRECGVNGKRHKIFARVIPQFALECAPQLLHRIIIKIMHQADDAQSPSCTAQHSAAQYNVHSVQHQGLHSTELTCTAPHSTQPRTLVGVLIAGPGLIVQCAASIIGHFPTHLGCSC